MKREKILNKILGQVPVAVSVRLMQKEDVGNW